MIYVTLEGLNLLPSMSVMDEVSWLAHSRPPVRICQIVMWEYTAPLQRKPWPGHLEKGLLPRRGQGKHQKNMKHLVVQRGGNVQGTSDRSQAEGLPAAWAGQCES